MGHFWSFLKLPLKVNNPKRCRLIWKQIHDWWLETYWIWTQIEPYSHGFNFLFYGVELRYFVLVGYPNDVLFCCVRTFSITRDLINLSLPLLVTRSLLPFWLYHIKKITEHWCVCTGSTVAGALYKSLKIRHVLHSLCSGSPPCVLPNVVNFQ